MSKIRNNYEQSSWRRLYRWAKGDASSSLQETMESIQEKEHVMVKKESAESEFWEDKAKRRAERLMKTYEDWPEKHGVKIFHRIYTVLSVLICVAIVGVLLFTVNELPPFGMAENPANNEVAERYLEDGMEETGAVNLVAGVILDYRAFDTLGESHVLFIAVCCVMILLRIEHDKKGKISDAKLRAEENDRKYEPKNDMILQKGVFFLMPPIMIYGIYVILNGHLSPGGGFSGGAILGAGLILYLNAFGFRKTERFFTQKTFTVVSLLALGFYSLSKTYSFFTGANHLESYIPKGELGAILSSGLILPLNICVGMVVTCTMYAFYALFRKGGF